MGDKGKAGEFTVAGVIQALSGATYHNLVGGTYGIDGFIELHNPGELNPCGRLIGVQVKTGPSHIEKFEDGSLHFRGENQHLAYWRNHQLKIIVAFVESGHPGILWQEVSDAFITTHSKSWTLSLDPKRVIGPGSVDSWRKLVDKQSPYQSRLTQLALAEPWMQASRTHKIVAEIEEWVNKTGGRGGMQILKIDEEGKETELYSQGHLWGSTPYPELFANVFPWADIALDEEFYSPDSDESEEPESMDEDPSHREFYPYKNEAGEVDYYRLELTLNDLGKAFLEVQLYLHGDAS